MVFGASRTIPVIKVINLWIFFGDLKIQKQSKPDKVHCNNFDI